jgi:hypothetical protein
MGRPIIRANPDTAWQLSQRIPTVRQMTSRILRLIVVRPLQRGCVLEGIGCATNRDSTAYGVAEP